MIIFLTFNKNWICTDLLRAVLSCPNYEQQCWLLLLPREKGPSPAEEGRRIFPPLTPHWDHDWSLPLIMQSYAPEALPRGQ